MEKPLIRSGNSLALVIDKPLRRMMGLGPSRRVDVRTDGRRLIVEALAERKVRESDAGQLEPAPAVPPVVLMNAANVARQLVELHGMREEELRRLFPDCRHVGRYMAHAQTGEHAPPDTQRCLYRMYVCHEQLVAGRPWEDAMAIAEYVVPKPPTDEIPKSVSSGART
jgi:antitoxin component of MazEF toxin-antitoxin module